jgi:hypothetical protein
MPQSCVWTSAGRPREEIEARVIKAGRGLHMSCGFRSSTATAMVNLPSRFRVELIDGWSITFGTSVIPSYGELTTRLMYITSQWNESAKQYQLPWQVRLVAQPWRIGETGEVSAQACPVSGTWDDEHTTPKIPLCATLPPTLIEAT